MKNLGITALVALAVITASCSSEEDFLTTNNPQNARRTVVLSATVGDKQGNTRATLDIEENKAVFKWATGDNITVFTSAGKKAFTLSSGEGTPTGSFIGTLDTGETIGELAYYPHHDSHTSEKFVLPSVYGGTSIEYVENTHAAYRATIASGSATFQPLTGLLCIKSKVSAGVNSFVLTATGKQIAGEFTVETINTEYVINTSDDDDNSSSSVTYNFAASDVVRGMTFYVPLPAGTYAGFKVELKKDGTVVETETKTYTESKEIGRGKMYVLDELNHSESDNMDYILTTKNGVATYTVYTPVGLQKVNKLITDNIADVTYSSANITLANNITLSAPANPATESNWVAIGTEANKYTGTFDGNNKTITGLVINSTEKHQGLIGYLGSGSTVLNVTLADCSVISEGDCVAGIVGYTQSLTTVSGCEVVSASSGVTIKGTDNVGGVIGNMPNGGTINDCHLVANVGTVSIQGNKGVGGLFGQTYTSSAEKPLIISDCFVANNTGNRASVTITGKSHVGGIAGSMGKGSETLNVEASLSNCKISECTIVANEVLNPTSYPELFAGAVVSVNNYGTVNGCIAENCDVKTTAKIVSGSNGTRHAVGGIAGKNMGYIFGCYAKSVVFSTANESPSVGSIVGWQSTKGQTIACYAYQCTLGNNALSGAANVLGQLNINNSYDRGILNQCYYYSKDDSDDLFTLVERAMGTGAVESPNDITSTTDIALATALDGMNGQLQTNSCNYKWTGSDASNVKVEPYTWP